MNTCERKYISDEGYKKLRSFSWKLGPYNKEYLGISHILNPDIGQTFGVELFPGMFRRNIIACPTSNDGGVKMWGANPALTHFAYRYELEWKDKVYLDAHFDITDGMIIHLRRH